MIEVFTMSRVSSDEQAEKGYSIQDQDDILEKHCAKMGYVVVHHFREDFSGKSFFRPEFKKALEMIRSRQARPAKFLFVRWDRFGRNVGKGYAMLDTLSEMGVEVNTVQQPIDHSIPEQMPMLAMYMAMPDAENRRRSLNIKGGIRRALMQGRYVLRPLKGYSFERQEDKRVLLVPNADADMVYKLYYSVSLGLQSAEAIYMEMRVRKNFKLKRSQFYAMLRNPLYMGMVRVPATKDEPEQLVKGLHAPIVPATIWNEVQYVLDGRRRRRAKVNTNSVNLPLRGHLVCPHCGGNLTGSGSKNRVGNVYYYYHCQKPCPTRFRADDANDKLLALMQSYTLPPAWATFFYGLLKDFLSADERKRGQDLSRINNEINTVSGRMVEAENLLFDKTITPDVYTRAIARYTSQLEDLRSESRKLSYSSTHTDEVLRYSISLISNLPKYYNQEVLEVKQQMLCSIFPDKLIFDGEKYRTQKANPLLELFRLKYNELQKATAPQIAGPSGSVENSGLLSNTAEAISPIDFMDSLESLFALRDLIPVEELV